MFFHVSPHFAGVKFPGIWSGKGLPFLIFLANVVPRNKDYKKKYFPFLLLRPFFLLSPLWPAFKKDFAKDAPKISPFFSFPFSSSSSILHPISLEH